jgi:hypothetical protein
MLLAGREEKMRTLLVISPKFQITHSPFPFPPFFVNRSFAIFMNVIGHGLYL